MGKTQLMGGKSHKIFDKLLLPLGFTENPISRF